MRTPLLLAATLAAIATSPCSHAGFDLGGMISAGVDAAKAATLSDADARKLAAQAAAQYDAKNQVASATSPYARRLTKITAGMKSNGTPPLDVKVYLKDEVNAFAMANGTIRVYSGLMDKMTDDEVRYVIGHEVGHVAKGHTRKALQTAYATSSLRKAGAASGNEDVAKFSESSLAGLAEKLVHAQFSQSQEHEADQYSLGFMKKNGYDTKAAISALRKLEQMFGNQSSAFSSHPAPGARAEALEKLI